MVSFEKVEIWLPIRGYEGYYEISDWGRVKSLKRKYCPEEMFLTPCPNAQNYLHVILSKEGKQYTAKIHVMVATHFLGDRPKGLDIHHLDGNKHNNHVSNLAYITHHENILHAWESGLAKAHHNNSKLTVGQVQSIRRLAKQGVSQKRLAKVFKVSPSTIGAIAKRKIWKEV